MTNADLGTRAPRPEVPNGDHGVADVPADVDGDLVSLRFIGEALRRGRRVCAGLALVGLLLGAAVWVTHPPVPEASTTLLLDVGPEGQPGTAILNDQVMAESRGVAADALRALGLAQSIEDLESTYTADVVTDRVLRLTVSAPTSTEAVSRANAIASAFLAFRADQLRKQQTLQFQALDKVLSQQELNLATINARIREVSGTPATPSQEAELSSLRPRRDRAENALVELKSQVNATKATAERTTAAMVGKSVVLDRASPLPQSHLKPLVLFSVAGLIAGLSAGLALVLLRALISDRLRRRDDVALALGAPVMLSIRAKQPSRRRTGRRGLAATRSGDLQRVVEFLRGSLPTDSGCRALAVVPVDDTRIAALSLVSLAASLAQENARVVVADLCSGAPAAKLVGLQRPGVHAARVDGAQIEVVIPDPQEIAPVGPLLPAPASTERGAGRQLAEAYESSDVLLTLATLDPSLASDHLRSWAADAVVVVTAGRSSWTKVQACGELIRLAGTRLVSALLVGADKWDESLGVGTASPGVGRELSSPDRDGTPATPLDHGRVRGRG
ncbi:MAG TPA: hypothetical protein VFT75_11975 [Nocardioidaceae bacterium]|jgi:capsular polysaccharide biosynthesis protein|nr:hypothetical protein [Nocardioidaceae bacterium]